MRSDDGVPAEIRDTAPAQEPNRASPDANSPPKRASATSERPDGAQDRPEHGHPAGRGDRASEQRKAAYRGQRPGRDAGREATAGCGRGSVPAAATTTPTSTTAPRLRRRRGPSASSRAAAASTAHRWSKVAAVPRHEPHERPAASNVSADGEPDVALRPGERRPGADPERGQHGERLRRERPAPARSRRTTPAAGRTGGPGDGRRRDRADLGRVGDRGDGLGVAGGGLWAPRGLRGSAGGSGTRRRRLRGSTARRAAAGAARGASVGSAATVPPCSSQTQLAMASPSPVPPAESPPDAEAVEDAVGPVGGDAGALVAHLEPPRDVVGRRGRRRGPRHREGCAAPRCRRGWRRAARAGPGSARTVRSAGLHVVAHPHRPPAHQRLRGRASRTARRPARR